MNEILKKVREYIKEALSKDKTGHDWNHTKRVLANALEIVKNYPEADLEILELSCLLHDIAFKNGFVEDHHLVGEVLSEEFLKKHNYPGEKIDKIKTAIKEHCGALYGTFDEPEKMSVESKILRDADNLDAVGSIGLVRMINFCQSQNFPIFISKDDGLNESVYGGVKTMISYKDKMLTKKGREICKQRLKVMEDFLEELENEFEITS